MTKAAISDAANHRRETARACLDKAHETLAAERVAEARALVNLAAELDLDVVRLAAREGDPALRILASQSVVLHGDRGREIGGPCAIFGTADTTLDPGKEALIRSIFDHHQDRFDKAAHPEPLLTRIYGADAAVRADAGRPVRVFMVMARHISANPSFVESDFFYHFGHSAAAAGVIAHMFEADALLYDTPEKFPFSDSQIADARRDLDAALARFRPDVIVFEGNFLPTSRTLHPSWLHAARQEHGCRVVTVLADCYDTIPNFYGTWAGASDVMLLFSQETSYPFLTGHADKAFFACSLPFDERLFAPAGEDMSDEMVVVGSNRRSRDDFVTALEAHGIPVTAHLHQRQAREAPDTAEYGAILRRAGMTFNTGRVQHSRSLSLTTGRCFEAILSRTVLLEEAGSRLDDYFVPFVHYVPFANTTQLVLFTQFLRANGDCRRRIAEQAFSWHQRHYPSGWFWGALLKRLGLPVAA